jgi:hypothetical protein
MGRLLAARGRLPGIPHGRNSQRHHRESMIARSHWRGSVGRNVRRHYEDLVQLERGVRGGYDVEVAVVDWIEHATQDPYAPARHVLLLAET